MFLSPFDCKTIMDTTTNIQIRKWIISRKERHYIYPTKKKKKFPLNPNKYFFYCCWEKTQIIICILKIFTNKIVEFHLWTMYMGPTVLTSLSLSSFHCRIKLFERRMYIGWEMRICNCVTIIGDIFFFFLKNKIWTIYLPMTLLNGNF